MIVYKLIERDSNRGTERVLGEESSLLRLKSELHRFALHDMRVVDSWNTVGQLKRDYEEGGYEEEELKGLEKIIDKIDKRGLKDNDIVEVDDYSKGVIDDVIYRDGDDTYSCYGKYFFIEEGEEEEQQ